MIPEKHNAKAQSREGAKKRKEKGDREIQRGYGDFGQIPCGENKTQRCKDAKKNQKNSRTHP
jgi:hypothetical protein